MRPLVAAYWRGVSDFRNGWHINPYAWSERRALAVMWLHGYRDARDGKVGEREESNDG